MNPEIVLILDNIRSCYNVGSIFRTADGAGVAGIIGVGITPLPRFDGDTRLPHIAIRADRQIAKTALGAESSVPFSHATDPLGAISALKARGYVIIALEQTQGSQVLQEYAVEASKLAVVLGSEASGLDPTTLAACDVILEIPMRGRKSSLNVAVAAGIALYQLARA
jgi:23S rRNA (guanosine2251-2'-O)-methyltransferase